MHMQHTLAQGRLIRVRERRYTIAFLLTLRSQLGTLLDQRPRSSGCEEKGRSFGQGVRVYVLFVYSGNLMLPEGPDEVKCKTREQMNGSDDFRRLWFVIECRRA
jgi:hypothetical protein